MWESAPTSSRPVGPVLIELMRRGYVSALAMNGAASFTISRSHLPALPLKTSTRRWVRRFGMAEETGRLLNQIIVEASRDGLGFGQAVGRHPSQAKAPFTTAVLTAAAHDLGVPVTVHVAIGTDIIHMHPQASGAATGDVSSRDFRYFTRASRGCSAASTSTADPPSCCRRSFSRLSHRTEPGRRSRRSDHGQHRFHAHVRPQTNVVTRPVAGTNGVGISLVGHHEILIPLIAAALIEVDDARA